jgi:hypothetical protein
MYALNVSDSLQKASDTFFNFLPNLLGFLVLLIIGLIVAKIVAGIVTKLLEKAGLDRRLAETDSGRMIENAMPKASAARGIGRVVFWLIFGFFLVAAVGALQLASVTVFMNEVLAYLPNVIVAILIFVVAALLAGAVSKAIERTMGGSPMGKIAGAVAPALIMVIAMFMILVQLKIAAQIVEIAFAATMGALALGLALAFGLGGRPVAQDMLEEAYRKGREEQARRSAAGPSERESEPASHAARADGPAQPPTSGRGTSSS